MPCPLGETHIDNLDLAFEIRRGKNPRGVVTLRAPDRVSAKLSTVEQGAGGSVGPTGLAAYNAIFP